MISSVAGLIHLAKCVSTLEEDATRSIYSVEPFEDTDVGVRCRRTNERSSHAYAGTYLMVSLESTEGTNSLLINSPVGILIFLPVAWTVISTACAPTMSLEMDDR